MTDEVCCTDDQIVTGAVPELIVDKLHSIEIEVDDRESDIDALDCW